MGRVFVPHIGSHQVIWAQSSGRARAGSDVPLASSSAPAGIGQRRETADALTVLTSHGGVGGQPGKFTGF
jgi:hypothetical protein